MGGHRKLTEAQVRIVMELVLGAHILEVWVEMVGGVGRCREVSEVSGGVGRFGDIRTDIDGGGGAGTLQTYHNVQSAASRLASGGP